MKIAYKHILRSLKEQPDIQELSKTLFQLGHEHKLEGDTFDMEITPNRGDCLSLNGILRDLQYFYSADLNSEVYHGHIDNFDFKFDNKSKDFCPKISFLKIEIKKNISEYKGCLKDYFKDLNLEKKNFFTDVSNYIMYETGQPTHCYDLEKITSKLSLIEINKDTIFKTLLMNSDGKDFKKIKLSGKNHVFMMNDEVINLAGIVGGETTSCSNKNETTSVLVECAYFCPDSIIGKSVNYDINSDAAYRFERGVDISSHDDVLRRFIKIVQEHVEINNISIFTTESHQVKNIKIPVDVIKINKILGTEISEEEYLNYINGLGFSVSDDLINIPSFRHDIENQNDMAEEVARLIGYNNIPNKEINIEHSNNKKDTFENKIREFLTDNGFYEVINAPFVGLDHNENSQSNKEKLITTKSIGVDNPLDSNKNVLRTNITDSLINNMIYNENRQKDSIKLFEISDIYFKDNDVSNEEKFNTNKKLSILGTGRIGKNYIDFSRKIDVDYMKDIFKRSFASCEFDFQVISRDKLGAAKSKLRDEIIFLEINLDEFPDKVMEYKQKFASNKKFINYEPISEFPSSTRDISYLLKDSSKIDLLQDTIFKNDSPILKEVFIFDFYENKKSDEIKIGFRFIFQSRKRTLTDDDIEKELKKYIDKSIKIDGIEIPGIT